jgi:hypothetical protein
VLDTKKRSNPLIDIHIICDRKVLNFPNFPINYGSYILSSGEKALFATSIGDGTETQNPLVAARRESLPGQQSKIAILFAVFRRGRPGQMEPPKKAPMRLFKNKRRFALASPPSMYAEEDPSKILVSEHRGDVTVLGRRLNLRRRLPGRSRPFGYATHAKFPSSA